MPTTNEIDSLWERVLHDDPNAFEEVVERFQGALTAIGYSRTGDFTTSQDVAQETFLCAWKGRHELRDPRRLAGWLCTMAQRIASRFQRQPVTIESMAIASGDEIDPSLRLEHEEEQRLVWSTLEQLPQEYRDVLVLYYRQDESVERVAEVLEISVDAVRQRLSRGRNQIRDSIAARVEGVLVQSQPGKRFTHRVMAAIAGLSASGLTKQAIASASGASVSGASASLLGVSKGIVASVGWSGLLGGLAGSAGGLAGAYAGTKIPALLAPTLSERAVLERAGRKSMWSGILFTLLVLLATRYFFFEGGWKIALPLLVASLLVYIGYTIRLTMQTQKQISKIRKELKPEDDPNPSPWSRRSLAHQQRVLYRGKRYRSRQRLLGLPWIDIQFADLSSEWTERQPGQARGWIALGDRADGVLLAIGGMARGGIAIGGLAMGGIAVGGMAAGICSLGGLALGIAIGMGGLALGHQAIGGGAVGWDAMGGGAVGWNSAAGGASLAYHYAFGGGACAAEYAVGGAAVAPHANDAIAKEIVAAESYQQWMLSLANHPLQFTIIIVIVSLAAPLFALGLQRWVYVREVESNSEEG